MGERNSVPENFCNIERVRIGETLGIVVAVVLKAGSKRALVGLDWYL